MLIEPIFIDLIVTEEIFIELISTELIFIEWRCEVIT
jgi:hypothetical protein